MTFTLPQIERLYAECGLRMPRTREELRMATQRLEWRRIAAYLRGQNAIAKATRAARQRRIGHARGSR